MSEPQHLPHSGMDEWPGDPIEDAKMAAESARDLASMGEPIDWLSIEDALRIEDGLAPMVPHGELTDLTDYVEGVEQ